MNAAGTIGVRTYAGWVTSLALGGALLVSAGMESCPAQSATTRSNVLFSTGFDFAAGYNPAFTLVGQNGWVGYGSGGNGLVTNFFEGYGQQAFIGFSPPDRTNDETLNVWQPINYTPGGTNSSVVRFSVLMAIMDSTNYYYDDFRWSVYNFSATAGASRLFTLDFDNATYVVSYALDDTNGFVSTGTTFTNASLYALVITMNFGRNLWSATANGMSVVNAKPITTTGAALTLGDVDAVWSIHDPAHPGNNYMVFDNYTVTALALPSLQPTLESVGRLPDGRFRLRLYGEPEVTYAVEGSTNLISWTWLGDVSSSSGTNDFIDEQSPTYPSRFYRASASP